MNETKCGRMTGENPNMEGKIANEGTKATRVPTVGDRSRGYTLPSSRYHAHTLCTMNFIVSRRGRNTGTGRSLVFLVLAPTLSDLTRFPIDNTR